MSFLEALRSFPWCQNFSALKDNASIINVCLPSSLWQKRPISHLLWTCNLIWYAALNHLFISTEHTWPFMALIAWTVQKFGNGLSWSLIFSLLLSIRHFLMQFCYSGLMLSLSWKLTPFEGSHCRHWGQGLTLPSNWFLHRKGIYSTTDRACFMSFSFVW